jgi:RNA polymerase sigma factor (sigma-70 family)
MAHPMATSVVRQIESLLDGGSVAGLSDRQLVERFIARRDAVGEAAFAALIVRHGPMVLGVCRQLLGDHHHAEDAFQAVFFVLARRARSVGDPDLLSNWLYGVAQRTARKAKARLARGRNSEEDCALNLPEAGSTVPADQPAIDRERAEALHDEIDRLPASSRLPVVLCYFEGLSLADAAQRLRCPAGTVHSRLVRARDKLRRGLVRRGVVLSGAALAGALAPRSALASVSSLLCDSTTRAAIDFATRHAAAGGAISTSAAALAQEVLHTMLLHKLRFLALTFLFLGAIATGAGYLTHALANNDEPKGPPANAQPQLAAQPDETTKPLAPGRMFVVGRVLDPLGKPVQGAAVEVIGRPRRAYSAADSFGSMILLGRGHTDSDGRFRLDAARTSSVGFFDTVDALTTAPGFGLGWAQLNTDAEQPTAEIRLRTEQLIRGKLVDLNGQPAAGVELRVDRFGEAKNLGFWSETSLHGSAPEEARTWPRSPRTDDQGRFVFSGVGRGLFVSFVVHDLRYAQQWLSVPTDDREGPKEITLALQPAKIIEGRVLAADTGQPIPSAVIDVGADTKTGSAISKFRADALGRFQANPHPADHFTVGVFAPEGPPYLPSRVGFAWTKGAVKKEIDVKLQRGIVIKGKVSEEGTGRSLAGASVQYLAINGGAECKGGWDAMVASKDDGSYQIVVPPGKGHLLIFGPTSDYILELIGGRMLYEGKPGGDRNYAHKIIAYEVQAGDQPHAIDAALRPGKTIKGRLTGPRGETVKHAAIITRLHIEPFNSSWRGDVSFQLHARDGSFELHGLDPENSAPVYFLDADHQWGASVELSGKHAGEDVMIQLQPNGQVKARFVGLDGQPIAKLTPDFEIIATPGPPAFRRNEKDGLKLADDAAHLITVDPKHYGRDHRPVTDAEGRITLPDLIPGALYRFIVSTAKKSPIRKDLTVKPGETLDLGDIVTEKPGT